MFLSHRFVICFCIIFSIFGLGYFWPTFIFTGACVLAAFLVVFLADLLSLYWGSPYVDCRRQCASQFSNGDVNASFQALSDELYPFSVQSLPFLPQTSQVFS